MGDLKNCPFCAEQIRAEAIVCRFCNRDVRTDPTHGGPHTPDIVDHGVSRDADRRSVQFEIRKRRRRAQLLAFLCFASAIASIWAYASDSRGTGMFFMLAAVGLLIAYLIVRPRYTGAECPHCHGFAVRRVVRSGIFTSSAMLHCDDCLADFGGVSPGCGCVVLIGAVGMLGSIMCLVLVVLS